MHNIATVYRFKTPLLDVKDELNKIEQVIKYSLDYIKSENLQYKIENNKTKNFQTITIKLWDFAWLVFSFVIDDKILLEKVFYPIFTMDLYFNLNTLNNNKQHIVDFLTNLFEWFDGVNEKEYLIDIDKNIYYKKWFLWKKVYPYYDFQELEQVWKLFGKGKWVEILTDFIKKYQKWFVLNMKTADEYHKVDWYLLYMFYLLYVMYQTLHWVDKNIDFIDNFDAWNYKGHLLLQKKRLENLWETTEQVYTKYLSFLENFLELFEK